MTTDTSIKDLGYLTINASSVYYAFPANSGLFQLGRKFTYYFDRQGVLRIIPTGDRSGYSVCQHHSRDGWHCLQFPKRSEPEFGVFPAPRGLSHVTTIDRENSGWFRFTLGEEQRPPRTARRKPKAPEAAPPARFEPGQGFRERLRVAQEHLNAAKSELGDDMQMRIDESGRLRVVVMLEI